MNTKTANDFTPRQTRKNVYIVTEKPIEEFKVTTLTIAKSGNPNIHQELLMKLWCAQWKTREQRNGSNYKKPIITSQIWNRLEKLSTKDDKFCGSICKRC